MPGLGLVSLKCVLYVTVEHYFLLPVLLLYRSPFCFAYPTFNNSKPMWCASINISWQGLSTVRLTYRHAHKHTRNTHTHPHWRYVSLPLSFTHKPTHCRAGQEVCLVKSTSSLCKGRPVEGVCINNGGAVVIPNLQHRSEEHTSELQSR